MLRLLILFTLAGLSATVVASSNSPFREDHAAALNAVEKVVEEREDYTLYHVEFNGIEGDRVPAHLYLPKAAKGRAPAALIQHGIGDRKQSPYITATCQMLAKKGVIALAIDAPNRGERRKPGKDASSILDPASVQAWFRQHCGDYSRALDYLGTRADVDTKRMGYIGFSWGGITGITFAAHDDRVRAMATIGAGGRFGDYLNVPASSSDKKLPASALDPADHIGAFAPRPLLLVNAKRDLVVLPMFAKALHKAAGAGSRVEWYDTDHLFQGMDRAKILGSVVDFLESSLNRAK